MKREVWSAHARADFDRHAAFLVERSPRAANTFADAILRATALLCEGDHGRIGRVEGTFEKLVRRQPYIILFEKIRGERLHPPHRAHVDALARRKLASAWLIRFSRRWPKLATLSKT